MKKIRRTSRGNSEWLESFRAIKAGRIAATGSPSIGKKSESAIFFR